MKLSKPLLIAAILFGLAAAFGIYYYLDNAGEPVEARVPRQEVVVANTTIPAHTRITGDMLEVVSISADAVHPEAASNTEGLVGGVSRTEIVRGEQVLSSRVYTEESRATFSYRIPESMRAVSIPVNEVTGVAGYLSPGDKVDVLVTYSEEVADDDEEDGGGGDITYTVFQNIQVLAVGEHPREMDDDESHLVNTATLKVTPEQAEVLAYAYLNGSYHLSLRSPVDDEVLSLDAYGARNFDNFRER